LRGRGLTIGSRRDGFSSAGIAAADSFSVERVEVIRGPQSLLYGPGDPGGVVNYVGKTATFGKNSTVLRGSVSSEGTYRAETDFNVGRRDFAFRVGGLVEPGSLQRQGIDVRFKVTDNVQAIQVVYRGTLPDLFKEGKGVVAQGSIGADGVFKASEVLAKHDENYMPPEAAEALKQAGHPMQSGTVKTP
jgi:cytochrome c-type biogenesis protein CcmE